MIRDASERIAIRRTMLAESSALPQNLNPIRDGRLSVGMPAGDSVWQRKVLIVAEHASARFGGEAALPLHYFRVMRKMGVDVHMITHARVRRELEELLGEDILRVHFIEDDALHRLLWKLGRLLPARVSYFTIGFASRTYTQILQRRVARRLVKELAIEVVHQPMPVSPREPSLLHDLGAPVVIGPLNGNMQYPPAFRPAHTRWKRHVEGAARAVGSLLNVIFPGKSKASAILVANERTREALPSRLRDKISVLVENGVDLGLWAKSDGVSATQVAASDETTHFVFMGRLVDWKAVDLLLLAFGKAVKSAPISLAILGDGPCRADLQALAGRLGILGRSIRETGQVHFAGWQSQVDCATQLRHSHALVLSSLSECGGAVVLEAMACGLPVIATAWGGPLDYLDERTGFLIEPSSRDDLIDGIAKAMRSLALSPELRERMGRAARSRIESDFDWDRKVEAVFAVYDRVCRQ